MSIIDQLDDAINTAFFDTTTFAVPATYQPGTAEEKEVLILPGEQASDYGGGQAVDVMEIQVRQSEVADPQMHDKFQVSGDVWRVGLDPESSEKVKRLVGGVWILQLIRDLRANLRG